MKRGSFLKGHKVFDVNVNDKETIITFADDEEGMLRGDSFKFVTKISDNGEKIQYYLFNDGKKLNV